MCKGLIVSPVGNQKTEVKKVFILKRYFEKITCIGASLNLNEDKISSNEKEVSLECDNIDENNNLDQFRLVSSMSF